MKKLAALTVILAVAGIAVALSAACGGGGGGDGGKNGGNASNKDLQEYFREVRILVNDIDSRTGDRTVQQASDAFAAWAIVLQDTAGKLSALTPPDDLAETSRDLYTALDDGGVAIGALASEHADIKTLEEAQSILSQSTEAAEANGRARAACLDMEKYAKDHDVSLDLELC